MEDTQPTPDKEPKGKIVTFYSYKGGVGRSMALANVAVLLAKMGKKVLIVDFDLEAPGLDWFFGEKKLVPAVNKSGVIGLLTNMREIGLGNHIPFDDLWSDEFENQVELSDGQQLSFVHSGNDSPNYVEQVINFSWPDFFSKANGAQQLEWLRDHWRSRFDFILIDSRTGITDIGGVCTVQLPDYLVLVFAANAQNLEGCRSVVKGIHSQRAAFGYDRERLQIIPLLSRFEGRAEKELSKLWLENSQAIMQSMLDDWLPKHTTALEYFDKTRLPHIPKYAFGEELACLKERDTDPDSLTYYYSAIARLIAGHLHRPDRLLSLSRRLSENEIEAIFQRASDLEKARASIEHIEKVLANATGPDVPEAQTIIAQLRNRAFHSIDLREDLEAVAVHAENEKLRTLALDHLRSRPDWTEQDTANLENELARRGWSQSAHPNPPVTQSSSDLELPLMRLHLSQDPSDRVKMINTLMQELPGDPRIKVALLRMAIGVPEQQILPDEAKQVRLRAIKALNNDWNGDVDVTAAFLRLAIGVPEQQIPPDKASEVRMAAVTLLAKYCSEDVIVKAALVRVAIGVPEQQIPPDEDRNVRHNTIITLRETWYADREVEEKVWRAVESSIQKFGLENEETKFLKQLLDHLTRT